MLLPWLLCIPTLFYIAHPIILYLSTILCCSHDYSIFQHHCVLLTRLFYIQTLFSIPHPLILYSNTALCCSRGYSIFKHCFIFKHCLIFQHYPTLLTQFYIQTWKLPEQTNKKKKLINLQDLNLGPGAFWPHHVAAFFFPFLRPGCLGVGHAKRSKVLARCRGRTAINSAGGMGDADRGEQALGTWGEEHNAASLSFFQGWRCFNAEAKIAWGMLGVILSSQRVLVHNSHLII